MRRMMRKENGLTAIGLMFVLATIAGVVLIVLRIFPLYNEKLGIESALNSVVSQPDAANFTAKTAQKAFFKNIAVTNVNRFNKKNIKEHLVILKAKKKGEPKHLHFKYESNNKFFADIYLTLIFDKKFPLTGPVKSE